MTFRSIPFSAPPTPAQQRVVSDVLEGIPEIQAYLRKSYSTINRWIKDYGLPAMKNPSGRWITTKSLIRAWIIARGSHNMALMQTQRGPFPAPSAIAQRASLRKPTEDKINSEKSEVLRSLYGTTPFLSHAEGTLRDRKAILNVLLEEV